MVDTRPAPVVAQDVHAGIAALVPALAAGAAEADRNRCVNRDLALALRHLGAHRLLQPAVYGGAEATVVDHVRAVAAVAEGCVAAGWCLAVWSVHNWMLAHFDADTQAAVWGHDSAAMVSGSIAPKTPFRDDGDEHLLVEGRFGFTSGVDHADWVLVGGNVERDGRRTGAMIVAPRAQVEVDQSSWQVMALRGTGSKDLVIDPPLRIARRAAFFPDDSYAHAAPGQAVNTAPLYRAPYRGVAILVLAPPALGAAKAALARFLERLDGHSMMMARATQRLDAAARLRVVESAADIDAAERTLHAAAEVCDELGRCGAPDALREAAVARDAAYAVRLCARAVDRLFEAAGGSALAETEPLQRLWRDVHGARMHAVLTWDGVASVYADLLLGPLPKG